MSEVGGRQEALDLLCYSLQGVERAMAGLGRLILVGTAFTLYLIALLFLLSIGNWQDAKQSPIASLLPYWKKEAETLFFCLAQIILFGWIYGAVVFVWRKVGLDYVDCFAVPPSANAPMRHENSSMVYDKGVVLDHFPFLHFNSGRLTAHGPGRVFFICSVISLVLVWSMLGYLYVSHILASGIYYFPSILFPLVAFWLTVGYAFVPYIPPFWSTRISLGAVIGQVLVAVVWPFWGVKFVHVIVGDLMTSAALTMWYIEWALCFFFSGEWAVSAEKLPSDVCGGKSRHALIMNPIMLILPFWIRSIQCALRVWETRHQGWTWAHTSHYVNLGKYMSCILVIILSSIYTAKTDVNTPDWTMWKLLWVASLIVKTVYCYIWDIYMDWDLGKLPRSKKVVDDRTPLIQDEGVPPTTSDARAMESSKHITSPWFPPFLRRNRFIPYTWVYYYVMVSNLIMRASWGFALSPHLGLPPAWSLLMSLVEIIRRGQWMIFRLENEHLQNQKRRRKMSMVSLYEEEKPLM